MKKKLLNLTDRQFFTLTDIAEEKELSLAEFIRRIFDDIIQKWEEEKHSKKKADHKEVK